MLIDKLISFGSLLAIAIWGAIAIGEVLDWEYDLEEEKRELSDE